MTVSEFREQATNIEHKYDGMDVVQFVQDPSITLTDKLRSIYGYIGSVTPTLYELDVKNILGITTELRDA